MNQGKSPSKNLFKGCIIEVDNILLDGIQHLYTVLREVLGNLGVALDEGLFAHHFLGRPLDAGLVSLKRKSDVESIQKVIATIRSANLERLCAETVAADDPSVTLVREVAARGVRVGLLTCLPAEAAATQLAPLLEIPNVKAITLKSSSLCGAFSREKWQRASEKLEMTGRLCTALVASGASHRAALASNLAVIALPSTFTDYQDYSGSYATFASLQEPVLDALLSSLRITPWQPDPTSKA